MSEQHGISPAHGPGPAHDPHQLVLVKKDQRWVFRYQPGDEATVLRQLAAAASNPDSGFDWFDAAVLSNQVGGKIRQQLNNLTEE